MVSPPRIIHHLADLSLPIIVRSSTRVPSEEAKLPARFARRRQSGSALCIFGETVASSLIGLHVEGLKQDDPYTFD
jgi:hypothetical protein